MKISIVIPTYNEKENLIKLVKHIGKISKNYKLNIKIIVVDDNSPDGTGILAEKLSKKYPLLIIHRKGKLGLGTAYITGFNLALKNSDVIFSMDADLSHNPETIPNFIKKIKEGYDVVIGSRYIKGGGIVGWGIYRKSVSKYANLFARTLLGLKIRDLTSGYRCYKKEVLKKINLNKIKSNGYSFLEEIIFLCNKNKFKIEEIPITFVDRKKGKSKLSKIEIFRFFITLFKLFINVLNSKIFTVIK